MASHRKVWQCTKWNHLDQKSGDVMAKVTWRRPKNVTCMKMFDDSDLPPDPLFPMCASGVAYYNNLKGPASAHAAPAEHHFAFKVKLGYKPYSAIAQLSLINISNDRKAVNLCYELEEYNVDCVRGGVQIYGRVLVGDSDGYLNGFSYMCIATPRGYMPYAR